jgi:hypothetical protein
LIVVPALACLLAFATSTEAAEGVMRVRVALELHGGYDFSGRGGQSAKGTYNDSYWSEITLKTDGVMGQVNAMDPESIKAQTAANQQLQEQAARVKGRSGMSGGAAGGVLGPGNMDMSKMMAMQEKVKACGNDQACKQRIAMEMMNEQNANASGSPQMQQVQAQMQAISNMCINEKHQPMGSKGYQDCMDTEGRKRATRTDNAVSAEELLPDRYLSYLGLSDDRKFQCKPTGHTKINRTAQGVRAEGGGAGDAGLIPYSYTEVGEGDGPASNPLCASGLGLTYDTKTNTIWASLPLFFPAAANVKSTAKGGNNTSGVREAIGDYNFVADVNGQHFNSVYEWIQKTLAGHVAMSGEKTQVFVHGGFSDMTTGSGKLTATLKWTIVRD